MIADPVLMSELLPEAYQFLDLLQSRILDDQDVEA